MVVVPQAADQTSARFSQAAARVVVGRGFFCSLGGGVTLV
jgi:hypothetical protein